MLHCNINGMERPPSTETPVLTLQAPAQDILLAMPSAAKPETLADLPHWAEADADELLKFLYVSPRPCEALDRLLAGA